MKSKVELAQEKFNGMYNCCQSVVCCYCEEFGVKEEDVFRMTEGFGLGMGGLKDTCGAVVGMFMTIGLANSAGDLSDPYKTKADTYEKVMKAAKLYEEKKGSIYCRDLLTEKGPQPLPCCRDCVKTAVEVVEMILQGEA